MTEDIRLIINKNFAKLNKGDLYFTEGDFLKYRFKVQRFWQISNSLFGFLFFISVMLLWAFLADRIENQLLAFLIPVLISVVILIPASILISELYKRRQFNKILRVVLHSPKKKRKQKKK